MLHINLFCFAILFALWPNGLIINCHGIFIRQGDRPRSMVPEATTKQTETAEEKLQADELKATQEMLNNEEQMAEALYEEQTGSQASPVADGPIPASLASGHGSSPPPAAAALQFSQEQQNEKDYETKITKLQEDLQNQTVQSEAAIQQDENQIKNLQNQEMERELSAAGVPPEESEKIIKGAEESTSFIADVPVSHHDYFGKLPDGPINAKPKEKTPSQEYNEKKKAEAEKALEAKNYREEQRRMNKQGNEEED